MAEKKKVSEIELANARQGREEEIDAVIKETLTKPEEQPKEEKPPEPTPTEKLGRLEKEIVEREAERQIIVKKMQAELDDIKTGKELEKLEEKKQELIHGVRPEPRNSGEPTETAEKKKENPILRDW